MGNAFTVIGIIVGLIVDFYLAAQFCDAANDKGYDGSKYLWICFLFPFAGYLLVIALPDRGRTNKPANSKTVKVRTQKEEEGSVSDEEIERLLEQEMRVDSEK